MMPITLRVTTTKPNSSIELYKDVDVMNHILNEYIFASKLVATTTELDDGVTVIATLDFPLNIYMREYLTDPIITNYVKVKKDYNQRHNIVSTSEVINE